MAALVAALFTQASDRAPWQAAAIARAFGRPGSVALASVAVLVIASALGAAAGMLMAPMLTPNARTLLLGFALLSAGVSALLPVKPAAAPTGRTIGAFGTAFVVLLAAAMGDRLQFLTAAIAARSDAPVFAVIGAVIGGAVIHVAVIMAALDPPPRALAAARRIIGAVMLMIGAGLALAAARLL